MQDEVKKELKKYDKSVQEVVNYATTLKVDTKEDYENALQEGKVYKDILTNLEKREKEIVDPMKLALKSVQDLFKPNKTNLQNALDTIKSKMSDWYKKDQQRQRDEEAKIAARVEKGTLKVETAVRKMGEIETTDKTVQAGEAKVTMAKRYNWSVEDITKVPYEYLEVNMVKVKAYEKATGILLPGIRKEEDISVRLG